MISGRYLGQDMSWSYSFRELQIGRLKLGEVPLEPQLNHQGWPVKVGLEGLTSGYLKEKVVEVSEKEMPHGHVIKGMEGFHKGDLL